MKATLYSDTYTLGTIEMKIIDESMGVVGGILTPNKAYFRLQSIFRESNAAYTAALQQLNINVQLENGCFLQPVAGYSITDDPEFPDEIEVHVVGSNYFLIFDTLEDNRTIDFVKEPWFPLTIESKLAFEKELRHEISLFRGDKRLGDHPFAHNEFHAFADYGPDDDVLFYTVGVNGCQFAVVHLTWTGNPEKDPKYPRAKYYDSFDEFKAERMMPDVEEWN